MTNWADYFDYDETSPSCLRWRVSRFTGKGYKREVVKVGDIAGAMNGKGYFDVKVDSTSYRVNRVIWEMFRGVIPEGLIVDHVDRKKANNRILNLRLVTNAVNCRNSVKASNNVSGVTGVSYRKRVRYSKVEEYWAATWKGFDGRQHSKNFSVAVHGDNAFHLACAARKEAIEALNADGAGYSESHGT